MRRLWLISRGGQGRGRVCRDVFALLAKRTSDPGCSVVPLASSVVCLSLLTSAATRSCGHRMLVPALYGHQRRAMRSTHRHVLHLNRRLPPRRHNATEYLSDIFQRLPAETNQTVHRLIPQEWPANETLKTQALTQIAVFRSEIEHPVKPVRYEAVDTGYDLWDLRQVRLALLLRSWFYRLFWCVFRLFLWLRLFGRLRCCRFLNRWFGRGFDRRIRGGDR